MLARLKPVRVPEASPDCAEPPTAPPSVVRGETESSQGRPAGLLGPPCPCFSISAHLMPCLLQLPLVPAAPHLPGPEGPEADGRVALSTRRLAAGGPGQLQPDPSVVCSPDGTWLGAGHFQLLLLEAGQSRTWPLWLLRRSSSGLMALQTLHLPTPQVRSLWGGGGGRGEEG